MVIKKIIYDGEEVECEVTFSWKLALLLGVLTIVLPLILVAQGAYFIATSVFVIAVISMMIGGNSMFYDFTPVENCNKRKNEVEKK